MANGLPKKLNTYQIETLQKAKKQLGTDETRRRLKEGGVYDETKRRYEATIGKEQQQPKQDIWGSITGGISKGISKLTGSTKGQAEMFEDQTKQQPTQTKTTNQITKQQEISPKYTEEKQITQKPTPTQSKTYTGTTIDTDKSGFLTGNELKGAEKEAYEMLNEQERKMFEEIGQDAARAGRDYVKEQLKFVRDVTGRKEYMTEQEKLNKKQKGISDEIQSIYDDRAIRESKEQLEDLKQNIGYLGTRGKPGVSSTKINAVSEQLSKAQTMVEEVQELISLREEARDLQEESRVLAFNDQISNLNTQLTDQINQAVLDSVNQLNSIDLQGKIESEDDLEKIRTELLQNLDTEISGITDGNIRQRQFLLDRFDKYTQEKKQERYRQEAIDMEYKQNAQIINEKMSNAKGYYVDGNGSPITGKDGMPIQIPKEAPMKPIYDKEEGKLITFRTDEATGGIVADVQQVIDEPTFTQETTNNYASLISKGKLDIEDVPENLRPSVINSMAAIPETEVPRIIDKSFDLGESFKVFYDDGSSEIISKDKPNSQVQSVRDAGDRLVMVYDDGTTQDIKKGKEQISELQKTQIDKLKAEIKRIEKGDELTDLDKAKAEQIRMQTKAIEQEISGITPTISTLTDMTSTLKRPTGSTNVGQDTNNPGNIMADNDKQKEYARSLGAIGFYKSPNGRTYAVFPDMETGLNATSADIKSKLEGGSYWVNENTTLGELANGWTSGPNAVPNEGAISNYEKLTGVNRNTKISDIPQQELISAIIVNEGVDITRSSTIPQVTQDLKTSTEIPIAFERQIKSLVPSTLMNSNVELKLLNEMIERLHKKGFSPEDAALTYMGFDIEDPENKEKAMTFVDIARSLGENLPNSYMTNISNFVNKGEDIKAMELTERVARKSMKSELGGDYIPENIARTTVERVNELQSFIKQLEATGENPIGTAEGTIENWLGRFKSKEAQSIATKATRLIAKMRNDLIGSTMTQTENTSIEALIPQLYDNVDNFNIKIGNLGKETLREINNQRESFGLPILSEDSIKNKQKRLEDYKYKGLTEEERLQKKYPGMGIGAEAVRIGTEIGTGKKVFPGAVNINSSDQDINNFLSQ